MDQQEIKTFKLFEALDENGDQSQRELSKKLEISLGLVNALLKKTVQKGFFKVITTDKSRLKYILTPKGISKKLSLTYNYLLHSIHYYRDIRNKVSRLFEGMDNEKVKDIIIFGVTDMSEIVYTILLEKRLKLVGIVDDEKNGQKFLGMDISDVQLISRVKYDALIITQLNVDPNTIETLENLGVEKKKIYAIPLNP